MAATTGVPEGRAESEKQQEPVQAAKEEEKEPEEEIRWSQSEGYGLGVVRNFRVSFRQNEPGQFREYMEKAIRTLDRSRRESQKKWFGRAGDWDCPCDVLMYPDQKEYSRKTGAPDYSPANTDIRFEGSRVSARIHCHWDIAPIQPILHHETAHVIMAKYFGPRYIPQWFNEGQAILSEPTETQDKHEFALLYLQRERRLLSFERLLAIEQPDRRTVTAFYAQSKSFAEFLLEKGGRETLIGFVRNGDHEAAALEHYGKSISALETEWLAWRFPRLEKKKPAAATPEPDSNPSPK